MTQILVWNHGADRTALVGQAVQALNRGELIGLPTETFYAVVGSALVPQAVARLRERAGSSEIPALTLALPDAGEALDWVPGLGPRGRRLARRCWPGPVTFLCSGEVEAGLLGRLPEEVRQLICPGGMLGLRVPDHDVPREILQAFPGPMVLANTQQGDRAPAVTAEELVQATGQEVQLVLDDGPSTYGQAATVVRLEGEAWTIERPGLVTSAMLEQYAACIIVFVCTGNTCRSPLAEALCKKRLADRLSCAVAELPRRGFIVLSAGLAAMMGERAAPEAVEVARERGADLEMHSSQLVTRELVAIADQLLVMTQSHLQALCGHYPQRSCQPRMLAPSGEDISDPIGCDRQAYEVCARHIEACLEGLLAELGV
jgi:protein-tyrosine phosphatase